MEKIKTVFIGGARAITRLDANVQARLQSLIQSGCHVVIGDAAGADKSVQKVLSDHQYKPVTVYASNGIVRNNLGDWPVIAVPVPDKASGFDFYACKDRQMAEVADIGFMIWNGKSRGTFENISNLTSRHKPCLVYYTPKKVFLVIKDSATAVKLKFSDPHLNMPSSLQEPALQFSMFAG